MTLLSGRRMTLPTMVAIGLGAWLAAEETQSGPRMPKKVNADQLPNAWRIADKVISGGLPEGDAAFQQLAELGVKTIISVDGMTPDIATAKKHGLRYVHLPHGYDGVPLERGKELAKAVRDLPGPVYIHCHHGKHRSPAAAAVACVSAGLLPASDAEAVLTTAGTNPNYRGLFKSVREARPLSMLELDLLKVEFREMAPIPPLAEAMVELEHAFDRMKRHSANQWKPSDDARAAALLLLEQYKEMDRLDDVKQRPARFRTLLQQGESDARRLEAAVTTQPLDSTAAESALKALSGGCASCHKEFRDAG